jgi:phage terminase large subunit
MVSAHISIIPEFTEKIQLYGLENVFEVTKNEIVNKLTGSKIIFKGIKTSSGNQTAALKSISGITTFVLDEAEEVTDEKDFDTIDESIRKKGSQNRVILILNPTTKEHWIYKRFFEQNGVNGGDNCTKTNVTYIHTTYLDNINNLSHSIIEKFELLKTQNPEKYKHRVLGGWLNKADGVVFTNWKVGEFVNCGQVIFGQDYGYYPDPTTLVCASIDSKRKVIYVKEMFCETGLSTEQIASRNKQLTNGGLIVGDCAEPRLINDLRLRGINIIPCQKGAGSIMAGINLLLEYQLIIDPNSTNIIKELNNYCYSDKGRSLVIDDYNHNLDSLRYCVYHQLKRPNKLGLKQIN